MEVLMRSPLVLILALIALAPASVAAQSGFWWSVGGGAGRNRVSCETCEEIKGYWGASGFVRAGGDVSPHVKVGGELHFWQASIEESDAYVRGIQAVVHWYPSTSGGFFGQVGLGLSRIRNSFDVGGETVRAAEVGLNVSAGVGWDIPVGKGIYLTPRVASVVVPVATIDTPAGPLENVVSTIYRFELGLTFR
jgi:Outer membrane protein beta-barrel domain